MTIAKKATKADTYLKVMGWGDPGAGKTRLALSFPDPLVIDLERGSRLYADEFDFWVAEPDKLKPHELVAEVLKEVQAGAYPDRKTLVIDPITDYLDALESALIDLKKKQGVDLDRLKGLPAAKVRGEIKDAIRDRLNALLTLPMHIVFVARAKNLWGENAEGKMSPIGRQADANEIVEYLCDIVMHLHTGGTATVKKSRLANLPATIQAPSFKHLKEALESAPKLGGPTQTPPASVIKPSATKTA